MNLQLFSVKKVSILFFLMVAIDAFCQCDWKPLGPSDHNQSSYAYYGAGRPRMAKDNFGNIYLVYADGYLGYKATVKKYDGTTWSFVGNPGFTGAGISSPDIAIDQSNTIYVAFKDNTNGNKATVMTFNGSAWIPVGNTAFSAGAIGGISLSLNPVGVPFVAFSDNTLSGKLTVMTYSAGTWALVGTAGFSSGQAQNINLAINSNSTMFIGYSEGASLLPAAMTFSNSSWVTITGSLPQTGNGLNMELDHLGAPLITLQSGQAFSYSSSAWTQVGTTLSTGGSRMLGAITASTSYVFFLTWPSGVVGYKLVLGNWVQMGTPIITGGFVDPDIIIDNTGMPVITWSGTGGRADVYRYDGTNMVMLGTHGFSDGASDYTNVQVDPTSVPHVVFSQGKPAVKKFVANAWSDVGNTNFSTYDVKNTSLLFSSTGTPYVIFNELIPFGSDVHVKTLVNGSWQDLSGTVLSAYGANYPDMTKDAADVLFAVYTDGSLADKATVKKFNGTTWVNVGPAGVSAGTAEYTQITAFSNTVYIAYADATMSSKVTVKYFDGSAWQTLGTQGFGVGSANVIDFKMDHAGVPYVAYRNASASMAPVIMYFNGSTWTALSTTGLASSVGNISIAFDSGNNVYLCYNDPANGLRAAVKKYNGTSWVSVGSPAYSSGIALRPTIAIDPNDVMYTSFSSDGAFVHWFEFNTNAYVSGPACENGNLNLSASGGSSYAWQGPQGFVSGTSTPTLGPLTLSYSGVYSVNISLGTCSETRTVSVTIAPIPTITVASATICEGQSATLNPSGALSYTYSGGSSVVSPVTNTSYSITGTAASGCKTSSPAIAYITVNAAPLVSVNSGTVCEGGSFTLSPTGAVSYSYLVTNTNVVSPIASSDYTVVGFSALGCPNLVPAIASLTVSPAPIISINSGTICFGNSYTLTPSGAATYTFSAGSNIVSPTQTTQYTVSGTSSLGCVSASVATVNITVHPLPVISVASGSICAGNSFTLVPSGADSYTYSGGSNVLSPGSTTSYTVTGSTNAGCTNTVGAVATISVILRPVLTAFPASPIICSGEEITLSVNGAASYSWNGAAGSSSLSITPLSTTDYTVVGTTNGCSTTAVITVNVSECTGLEKNESTLGKMVLWPNPSNDFVTVQLVNSLSFTGTLYNTLGQLVMQTRVLTSGSKLDISSLPAGTYYLRVDTSFESLAFKIIKE